MARCFERSFGIIAIGLSVFLLVARFSGIRLNQSGSLPSGIWIEEPLTGQRGQTVSICPVVSSWGEWLSGRRCGWEFEHHALLKPVAAVEGDTVVLSHEGISVNGQLLPNSSRLERDSYGFPVRHYPHGHYKVEKGTVWLVSSHHPRSFDSRYFGPVPVSFLDAAIRPLWIWNKE